MTYLTRQSYNIYQHLVSSTVRLSCHVVATLVAAILVAAALVAPILVAVTTLVVVLATSKLIFLQQTL